MGSITLSFISGIKYTGGKISHPRFFQDYHKNSTGVTKDFLSSYFVNSLNIKRKTDSKNPAKKRKLNDGEASNCNVKDNEADVLNKLIPNDCKMEFSAFPIHLGDNEVVLQVSLEVPACYIKEGIEYIHAVFKNNDALLVEKLDLSDLSFDLKKTRAAMQVTDRVIYSNPEVRSSVNKIVKPNDYFFVAGGIKRRSVYNDAPKMDYDDVVETLILTGKLITFPIYRSQPKFFQQGLQTLFIKDYERLQQIMKPYVKRVTDWVEKVRCTDEEYFDFKLALEEMKKIVEDKSLVGFLRNL